MITQEPGCRSVFQFTKKRLPREPCWFACHASNSVANGIDVVFRICGAKRGSYRSGIGATDAQCCPETASSAVAVIELCIQRDGSGTADVAHTYLGTIKVVVD